jgi:hypothetical protein
MLRREQEASINWEHSTLGRRRRTAIDRRRHVCRRSIWSSGLGDGRTRLSARWYSEIHACLEAGPRRDNAADGPQMDAWSSHGRIWCCCFMEFCGPRKFVTRKSRIAESRYDSAGNSIDALIWPPAGFWTRCFCGQNNEMSRAYTICCVISKCGEKCSEHDI